MNVNISFSAEIETTLLRLSAASGKDVETVITELVTERLAEEHPPPVKSHEDFMASLHRIIDLHPTSNGSLDDSRESIYAGRCE